jgi:hypothetical protein
VTGCAKTSRESVLAHGSKGPLPKGGEMRPTAGRPQIILTDLP